VIGLGDKEVTTRLLMATIKEGRALDKIMKGRALDKTLLFQWTRDASEG
jgi:hypothetical protein